MFFDSIGIRIAVTGIYCHQTPKVNFSGMKGKSCELGDLLWCHVHSDIEGNVIRNAVLYQAKMSSVHPYRLHGNDEDQLKLYSSWPAFTYVTSGTLNSEKRHVKPSAHVEVLNICLLMADLLKLGIRYIRHSWNLSNWVVHCQQSYNGS